MTYNPRTPHLDLQRTLVHPRTVHPVHPNQESSQQDSVVFEDSDKERKTRGITRTAVRGPDL